jgi:hypothetical protein
VGALVPVKVAPDPNLLEIFGFGRDVSRSDCEKAEDLSASDFGSSLVLLVTDAPVAAGDNCRAPSSEGFCARALMAAISTFPTGS